MAVESSPSSTRRTRLVSRVFLLVTFSNFLYFLSVGAMIPVLPLFVEGVLDGGDIAVGVSTGAFSLAAVVLRPWSGRLADRRGRRIVVVTGAGLVAGSVVVYTLVDSFAPLLALRLISGAGESLFYVGVASAINDLAPDERRGEALSYFSLALYGGLAVGPVVGELVLGDGRFNAAWLTAAALAFGAMAVGFAMPETRPEAGADEPVTKRLIHPAAVTSGTILASSVWGLAGFMAFVPLYALHLGMDGSGYVFVLYSSIVLSVRSFGARIPDRFGVRPTARTALVCSALGLTTIGLWASPAGLFAGAALFGLGQSLAFPSLMAIAVRGAPSSERGSVVATFTAFFDLGFGVGAVTFGALASAIAYRGAFMTAAAVAIAGLALLLAKVPAARADAEVRPAA